MKLVELFLFVLIPITNVCSFPKGTPPSFNSPLEDQVVSPVDAGGTQIGFALTCDVSGDPAPDITWYRGGQQLSGETGTTLIVNPPISDVDATVSGVEYYCIASSSTFGTIRSRTATVRRSFLSPWSVSGVRTVEARVGFSVAIPCNQPASNPPSHVAWTVDGGPLSAADVTTGGAAEDQRIQLFPDGHLVVHDLRPSDFNVSYRCSVDNANIYNTSISPQITKLIEVDNLSEDSADGIHVYYHQSSITAEVGSTARILNVVAPVSAGGIFPEYSPNIGRLTSRNYYEVDNVGDHDGVNVTSRYLEHRGDDRTVLGELTTTVIAFERPRIVSTSGPHAVLVGRRVILECEVDTHPIGSIHWTLNTTPYPRDGTRVVLQGDRLVYVLNIESVQLKDSGMFQCTVTNPYGAASGSVSLSVKQPELTISTPLSRETAFVEGDNVTLTVAVKSDDPPKMTWIVRGVELTTSDNNSTYVVGDRVEGATDNRGLTEYSTTLNVLSINTTYEGEYRVEASTEIDGLMVTTKGNVLQERLVTSVSVEYVDSPCLLLGANVTLRCNQNGVPRATVQWTKGSVQLTNGGRFLISEGDELTLTVFNVEESDKGEYTCTGNNTLRDGTKAEGVAGSVIASQVCVPPKITDTGSDTSPSANIGETVSLACTVSGVPRPVITWLRGDSPIIPSDRIRISVDSNVTHITSRLEVSNLMESDGGSYTCSAANEANTVTFLYQIEYHASVSDFPWWAVVVTVAFLLVVAGAMVFITAMCVIRLKRRSVPGTVVQNYRLRHLLSDVDEESSQFAKDHEQSTTLL